MLSSDLLASDTATPPFSSTLGTAVPQVEVGEGQWVQVGLLANAEHAGGIQPADNRVIHTRNTMRALASLAGLTTELGAASTASMHETSSTLDTTMSTEAGVRAGSQNTLARRKTSLSEWSAASTTELSSVEDVDVPRRSRGVDAADATAGVVDQIIAQSRSFDAGRLNI